MNKNLNNFQNATKPKLPSRGERGDVATQDDDLEKSESYLSKSARFKKQYKDFYDDIKLSSKEDW